MRRAACQARERPVLADCAAMAHLTTSDGLQLAYTYDDSAPAEAPTVVLLHGFAVPSHLTWEITGIADALADAGRRTLQLDARGHGDSDGPVDATYGEARMAQDVRELLDHLELGAVDLVGHSMGAITALLVAASDPRVRRLSLSGVGDGVLEVGGLDQRQMPGELLAQGLRAATDEEVEHPLGSAWRSFARTLDGNLPALAAQAAAMHTGGVDLGAIMASAQLLLGSADNLAAQPERLAEALGGAPIVLLEGADHLGTPTHPEFAERLIAFLGRAD